MSHAPPQLSPHPVPDAGLRRARALVPGLPARMLARIQAGLLAGLLAVVVIMTLGLTAAPVLAAGTVDSMRCDRVFIRPGDSKFQVLKACGDPQFQDQVSGEDGPRVEHWVYPSDWSRFDRMIVFVAGKVVRIERLDD